MPIGKTHDIATVVLAVPAAMAAQYFSGDAKWTFAFVTAYLFGGLMFGPDLDTRSRPYARWSIFKFIWLPYRWAFAHRSAWTHGLLASTLLRLIYFLGMVTLVAYASALVVATVREARVATLVDFSRGWRYLGAFTGAYLGNRGLIAALAGVWTGAFVHTLLDVVVTYVKTGRVSRLI
ncbi:MAG: metal-binding protein [Pyrinomonadaceae bacterium]